MKDPARRDKVDQSSSEWIDVDPQYLDPDSQEIPINYQDVARVADLQLVDAMLAGLSDRTRDEQSERIRRVMSAITGESGPAEAQESESTATVRREKFLPWSTLLALAACLLVISGISSALLMRESRAATLLPQINEVATQNIDRVYDIHRVLPSADGTREELRGRLYLRGIEGFVVTSGGAVFGRSSNEFWFVSPAGKVIIADDFSWIIDESEQERQELGLLKELSVESSRIPLMQLSSVAELMQHDYEVTVQSGMQHGQQAVDELVGKQKSGNRELPDTIRLWSGAESRIIHGAQFVWENDKETSQPSTLVFELVDAEVVPENWYNLEAHH
jgi:hypothetical protein